MLQYTVMGGSDTPGYFEMALSLTVKERVHKLLGGPSASSGAGIPSLLAIPEYRVSMAFLHSEGDSKHAVKKGNVPVFRQPVWNHAWVIDPSLKSDRNQYESKRGRVM